MILRDRKTADPALNDRNDAVTSFLTFAKMWTRQHMRNEPQAFEDGRKKRNSSQI